MIKIEMRVTTAYGENNALIHSQPFVVEVDNYLPIGQLEQYLLNKAWLLTDAFTKHTVTDKILKRDTVTVSDYKIVRPVE